MNNLNDTIVSNYFLNFDNLENKIVLKFDRSHGGIGDFCKFFMILFEICVKNNIKMYYLLSSNSLDDFIKLKYEKMYIKETDIHDQIYIDYNDIQNINSNHYYIIHIYNLYCIDSAIHNEMIYCIDKLLYFTDEVKLNSQKIIKENEEYISIHLRLGDSQLEVDEHFIHPPNRSDKRIFDETSMYDFIEKNSDKKLLFFCDNNKYKIKIKDKYNFVKISDFEIGHTSIVNTTRLQVLNAVSEFFILSNSMSIYNASFSGFSIMASKFKNIKLLNC